MTHRGTAGQPFVVMVPQLGGGYVAHYFHIEAAARVFAGETDGLLYGKVEVQ